jgi:hypothetical protein
MIHLAGPMSKEGVQLCIRCDAVLTDYRNAVVPEGTPPLQGWKEGAHIEVIEGHPRAFFTVDDEPNCRRGMLH